MPHDTRNDLGVDSTDRYCQRDTDKDDFDRLAEMIKALPPDRQDAFGSWLDDQVDLEDQDDLEDLEALEGNLEDTASSYWGTLEEYLAVELAARDTALEDNLEG
ncbi:MAG: hypothetical protein HY914_14500 [Desulfomonile tiedjei]|nr:hypothetical protein [Desulfomonile tiedjei]